MLQKTLDVFRGKSSKEMLYGMQYTMENSEINHFDKFM